MLLNDGKSSAEVMVVDHHCDPQNDAALISRAGDRYSRGDDWMKRSRFLTDGADEEVELFIGNYSRLPGESVVAVKHLYY